MSLKLIRNRNIIEPMLVGHLAVGFAANRIEPRISLGTLVLAALFADFLWCFFMIGGIEQIQIKPGIGAANYIGEVTIPYSHSLLMDVIWALLFAAAYFFRRHYSRGALILFIIVLSHWFLDFIAHPPDMPVAPGVQKYFGLGLWNSVVATLIIEGGFWLLAIILYARATHPQKRLGTYAFWIVVALLTLAWYNNIAGPPPKDSSHMGISSLIFFSLIVAWAYWMNRLRPMKSSVLQSI